MAKAIGATAISTVIRSASTCVSMRSMSNRRCSRIHTPVCSAVTMLSSPRMCDGGVAIWIRSREVNPSASRQCTHRGAQRRVGVPNGLGQTGGARAERQHRIGIRRRRAEGRLAGEIGSSRCSIGIRSASTEWSPTAWDGFVNASACSTSCALPGRTDQHDGRGQPPDGMQRDDELGPVGRHQGNPITGRHTTCVEARGQPVSQRVQLRHAVVPLSENERSRPTWRRAWLRH